MKVTVSMGMDDLGDDFVDEDELLDMAPAVAAPTKIRASPAPSFLAAPHHRARGPWLTWVELYRHRGSLS